MRSFSSLTLGTGFLCALTSSSALVFAQPSAAPPPDALAPEATPTSAAPSAPVSDHAESALPSDVALSDGAVPPNAGEGSRPSAPASARPICVLGVGRGDPNAETAASLICEKLREQGVEVVTVHEEIPAPKVYRVHLRPLGSLYYLELLREEPPGQVVASRRLQVGSLEQVPVAAHRLVKALVDDVPVEDTANAHTLVAEETRQPDTRSNQIRFAVGVAGVLVGQDLGYGGEMAFGFLGSDYGAHIRGRAAGGEAYHLSLMVSGWRYFGSGDIAPLIGVGFGIAGLEDADDYSGSGVVVEPTVGVELFRFEKSRVLFTAQLDIPLFQLEKIQYSGPLGERTESTRYSLGGGLGAAFVF